MTRDPLARPDDLIRRVYSYVAYRIGHGSDAEDVTSETMLRAVRYRSTFKSERGKPISWLIGIARTCIAEHLAAQRPTAEPSDGPSSENLEAEAVERLAVGAAVARLDQRERELVALRYGADLSTREIAALVDLTPNAVDVALHRCRAKLRGELEHAGASVPRSPRVVRRPSAEPLRP